MLQRSCWKIPKTVMTVEVDGETVPAFVDVVTYDESPQFAYVMAAQWERPDIAAAGGTREDLSKSIQRGRFVRTTVKRKAAQTGDPDDVLRVKGANVLAGDDVLEADVPMVLFAGDVTDDLVGAAALTEASERIAQENKP